MSLTLVNGIYVNLKRYMELQGNVCQCEMCQHLRRTNKMPKPTDEELDNRFRYHRPTAEAVPKHEQVTELTLALAKQLRDICPEGRNLSIALTELESVRMRANAAIACDSPR